MRNSNRINYVLDWIQYVQCTKCMEVKSIDMFCKAKRWLFWKKERCKDCDKKYREEHREHIINYLRNYYNNDKENLQKKHAEYREKNRSKIKELERQYYNLHKEETKIRIRRRNDETWYEPVRQKSKRLIAKLWIRPSSCPLCWYKKFRIEAHHPDYNKRNEIVFCCKSCHQLIHSWKIRCPQTIDLCLIKGNV